MLVRTMGKKEKEIIKDGLLNAIENEMDLVIGLRRKYQLGFALYSHVRVLLKQQEDVIDNRYWLERKSLDDSHEMVTAYFNDGSHISFRRVKLQEVNSKQIKQVI